MTWYGICVIEVERQGFAVTAEQLQAAEKFIEDKPVAVPQEFIDMTEVVMREKRWQLPSTAVEAKELYLRLLQELEL